MAVEKGKSGAVYFNSTAQDAAYTDSWTLDLGIETDDITAYGDSGRTNIQTIRTAQGSFVASVDMGDTGQAGLVKQFTTASLSTIALHLYLGTTVGDIRSFDLSAALNRCSVRSQVGTKVSVEFGFVKGVGNVSYATT